MTAASPDPIRTDPMLRVVRERHREVDIVVLPDPTLRAAGPPLPPAPAVRTDDVVRRAGTLLEEVRVRLAGDEGSAGGAQGPHVVHRWRTDELGRRFLESRLVLSGLAQGENVRLLRSCGDALVGLGWRARPVPARRPGLVAVRGSSRAWATVTPSGFQLFLVSGLLVLAEAAGR